MPSFQFLHAADLHLGSPLTGLAGRDADLARRLAAAGRGAFEDLVTFAIEKAVAFVVVAGDIYDGDWADASIGLFFARQVGRLDRAGIPIVMVRGNHDAESVITRSITLPPSVHVFPANRATTHRLETWKVALHGRSFPNRAVEENIALGYPSALPGWFNLGVLHTSCTGSTQHATYAPCSVQDLALRGYDYWALGHIHEYQELSRDPWIVFPGNLQGRSVRECGPRGAVLVSVEEGRVREVERLVFDRARFERLAVDVSGVSEPSAVHERVEAALRPLTSVAASRLILVRVHLTGESAAHDRLCADRDDLAAEVQAAAHRVHEEIWLERLKVETRRLRAAAPALTAGLDPGELMAELERDPEFRERAKGILAEIVRKMPSGVAEEAGIEAEFDALCAEAQALVLGRLSGRTC